MVKPFGKDEFGGTQEGSYYFKELQANRIKKKLDLIQRKLGDINKIVTLLETKLNDLQQRQEEHGHN